VKQRLRQSVLPLVAALTLAGCATTPPEPPPQPAPSASDLDALSRPSQPSPTVTAPIEPQPYSPLDDPSSPLYRKIVYFDYDTSEIPGQYTDLLRAHAAYLYQTAGARVTLEGHTDERGTRDYNLALGERRADAVKRFMIAEGVPEAKMGTLSYGEERPADPGHSADAWSENRRVELVY
jgi:peptidoglycan-associated lipoprotein